MSDLEDDFNPRAHTTLLQAISGLKKSQHIRQSTRNEPKIKQDEFQLTKGISVVTTEAEANDATPATAVAVNDLVQVLRKKKKHLDAGKFLKNVHRTRKVFEKPLEKPAADRIKRKIGYEGVKTKLERWDAVVTKNRVAETQVFPLSSETIYIDTAAHAKPLQHALKSDLKREMEAAEEKLRQLKRQREGNTDNQADLEKRQNELLQVKLTRDELMARRKELAYLKMRESQQSARARMRNKIKSKKYHKLLRRQKLQAQLKEFEQLQKTNPEAALEKLNELEKSRVLERATLRHKNTGSWAKNLQVRAKYDKDVRKDLSEQLQISKELTQKQKQIDDTDQSDENSDVDNDEMNVELRETDQILKDDAMNPWLTNASSDKTASKPKKGNDENWRKYWIERNENSRLLEAYKKDLVEAAGAEGLTGVKKVAVQSENAAKHVAAKNAAKKLNNKTKNSKKVPLIENGWLVEEIDATRTEVNSLEKIDDIFDEVEERMETDVAKKLEKLKNEAKYLSKVNKQRKPKRGYDALKHLKDLSFKNEIKHPLIDEELNNQDDKLNDEKRSVSIPQPQDEKKLADVDVSEVNIDPTSFPVVTLKQPYLHALTKADNDAEMEDADGTINEHHMTISEAFEDDDIIADFNQEKSKDAALKNTEIELSMPGWGSWAGAGIDESTQKKRAKRIVLKLAPEEKRRDENKDQLYINEEANKHLRTHLVSDVPFPFHSVQDYEASIRAPIGRNFVPETAFRMLTRPAVITRKGAVIEPMDDSELVKPARRLRHEVDKRINVLP